MNKAKKTVAAAIAISSVLSVSGCSDESRPMSTTDTVTTQTTSQATTTTLSTDRAVQEQVEGLSGQIEEITVDKKIKWLSHYRIDETSATAELFKATYGIPEKGDQSYGDDADNIFEYINVPYADRLTKLATMIQSGDSPDMFGFDISDYPMIVRMGAVQPIDGIIDIDSEEWSETRELMRQFEWDGKNYCAIPAIETNTLLWYRRSVLEDAGLEDPYDLYRSGNWNWDTFTDMCSKFVSSGSGKYAIDGWYVQNDLIATTGTPLVSIENGKAVSNLNNSNVERAMELISSLCKNEYRYPYDTLNGWQPSYKAWANGDTLFFDDGTWRFNETWVNYRDKYGWDDEEIFFVPAPKDPMSDVYYQNMMQDSVLLVKGSDNVNGFKAWVQCMIACTNDESVSAAQREKDKRDFGWTDEQLDFLDELTSGAMSSVFDFRNGLSNESDNTYATIINTMYLTGDSSYTQLRAENENIINSWIDELNS